MNRKRFITVVASLSVFCMSMTGMNAVWARDGGSEKFDPQPVSSDWEQKDMKGTYAYFVSGKDWVGVYKYDADDDTCEDDLPLRTVRAYELIQRR